MRLLIGNCILLACLMSVLATEQPVKNETRPKRDLQFWKSLIAAKLGLVEAKPNDENVKILRIPGFENVLVRAVPKVTVVEETRPTIVEEKVVQVDPTLALLGAYLGTKTPEETLIALQRVKGLLQSGIIKAREEVIEVMPPKPPVYVFPSVTQEKKDCPQPRPVQVMQKMPMYPVLPPPVQVMQRMPMYPVVPPVMPVPTFRSLPMPALRPLPMPTLAVPALKPLPVPIMPAPVPIMPARIPVMKPPPMPQVIVPQMRPLPLEPVMVSEFVPSHYSYKQFNGNKVTSFLSSGSDDVIVTESRLPIPPPPKYIIDRFQKMIYGLPLGVTTIRPSLPPIPVVPKPMVNIPFLPLMPGPVIPQPAAVITQPSVVDVKVDKDKKMHHGSFTIFEGTKVMKEPFTSTLVQEQLFVPAPQVVDVPVKPMPSVLIGTSEPDESNYKRVHGNGTMTMFAGTATMKEPFTSVTFEDLSKLPPPPPEILNRIEEAAGRAHHPKSMWGYSFKLSNGVGYFKNNNKDKIFYSRLLSGGDKSGNVVPDPLSSQNDKEDTRNPNNNVFVIGDDQSKENNDDKESPEKDEFGNPFLSKKINGEDKQTSNPNDTSSEKPKEESPVTKITPVKMIPPLPTPIAGENEKDGRPKVIAGASYTLLNNGGPLRIGGNPNEAPILVNVPNIDLSKERDRGDGSFSYTQIDGNGKVTTTVSNGKTGGSVLVTENNPKAVIDVLQPVMKTPSMTEKIKHIPAFPQEVIDVIQPLPKPPSVLVAEKINNIPAFPLPKPSVFVTEKIQNIPAYPKAVIDVIQPMPKPSSVIVEERLKTIPAFPKAVVDVIQSVSKTPSVLVTEQVKNSPVRPSAVIDVIQPVQKPVAVIGDKRAGVFFPTRVKPSYIYKLISHGNPQPFTVVQVEDKPRIEVPKGDVHVKVNKHEHIRADGTRYPCREVHLVPGIPIAPISPIPTAGVEPTIPSALLYVPPATADLPPPTKHHQKQTKPETHFSYTQVKNEVTTTTEGKLVETTTDKPLSLSLNPIVVPEESNYSYTQSRGDGSSINFQSNKDNTVSVTVEDESNRGDIPDALS